MRLDAQRRMAEYWRLNAHRTGLDLQHWMTCFLLIQLLMETMEGDHARFNQEGR